MSSDAVKYDATAFGLRWRADVLLPRFGPAAAGDPDVVVGRVDRLAERALLKPINRGHVCADGVRFVWEREVAFDLYDGMRIDYAAGEDWRGSMPLCFYSTIAALTLAWRGALPMHACAVEVDGRAILICGAAGSGKSTLAAGLLAAGASFIADDLTAVVPTLGSAPDRVPTGRPAMRLHPALTAWIDCAAHEPDADGGCGKRLVRPTAVAGTKSLPLAGFLILGGDGQPIGTTSRYLLTQAQLFRPRWLAALPNAAGRARSAFLTAQKIRMAWFASGEVREEAAFRERANDALALIRNSILQ